jgi:hypothetical protein
MPTHMKREGRARALQGSIFMFLLSLALCKILVLELEENGESSNQVDSPLHFKSM